MTNETQIKETNIEPKSSQPEELSKTGIASIQGEDVTPKSEWIDRGIIDVPVNNLPNPENVEGPEDFNHHISWEDAQAATKKLPEIQKQVQAGKTGDDFSQEDLQTGKDYPQGNRRIYDLYYGSDPVVLDKEGENYTIISGRHRIFAAKESGLETIPARVKEKVTG